jgi:hypothetical protein
MWRTGCPPLVTEFNTNFRMLDGALCRLPILTPILEARNEDELRRTNRPTRASPVAMPRGIDRRQDSAVRSVTSPLEEWHSARLHPASGRELPLILPPKVLQSNRRRVVSSVRPARRRGSRWGVPHQHRPLREACRRARDRPARQLPRLTPHLCHPSVAGG